MNLRQRDNMNTRTSSIVLSALITAIAACDFVKDGMQGQSDAVARVDGFTLTIDHAAHLLSQASEGVASVGSVEPPPTVVDPLTDLWVGYTLLASQLASPDTFSSVDLTLLTRSGMDQGLVWLLHDGVIMAQINLPEVELQEMYEQERPFDAVEAQHILVAVPASASIAVTDSLRQLADNLHAQLLAGADFAALARQYSDDPATASRGGQLGWIERNRLVPELEEVVFGLEPGTISEPVRSSLGFHIIRVIELDVPGFQSAMVRYRAELIDERMPELEAHFIESLIEEAKVRLAPGAVFLAPQIAASLRLERLSAAERRGVLARYKGGTFTVGEFADHVIRGLPNSQPALIGADSIRMRGVLLDMVRGELLAKAARERGYHLAPEVVDSIRDDALRSLFVAATLAGFRRNELVAGDQAIAAAVDQAVIDVLTRQRSPWPMAQVALALRAGHTIQVYPSRFSAVTARLVEIIAERQPTNEQAAAPASDGSTVGESLTPSTAGNRN